MDFSITVPSSLKRFVPSAMISASATSSHCPASSRSSAAAAGRTGDRVAPVCSTSYSPHPVPTLSSSSSTTPKQNAASLASRLSALSIRSGGGGCAISDERVDTAVVVSHGPGQECLGTAAPDRRPQLPSSSTSMFDWAGDGIDGVTEAAGKVVSRCYPDDDSCSDTATLLFRRSHTPSLSSATEALSLCSAPPPDAAL
jgi:hypothetical protein